MKNFTKSDLKTGMGVVTRCGDEFIVFKDTEHESGDYLLGNDKNTWEMMSAYDNDLTDRGGENKFDIIEVYEASHPYLVSNFFGMDNEEGGEDWKLVWKREEENNNDKYNILNILTQFTKNCVEYGIDMDNMTLTLSDKDFDEAFAYISNITSLRYHEPKELNFRTIYGLLKLKKHGDR